MRKRYGSSSNNNKLQGLRSKVLIIDEWLSGDIREDVVWGIETSSRNAATEISKETRRQNREKFE